MNPSGSNPKRLLPESPRSPQTALIGVLGASNVSLGLPEILAHTAIRFRGRPVELHVAHGPGRSYGVEAGVFGIRFPALRSCAIFAGLEQSAAALGTRPAVLLTDIGNDIGYGTEAAVILSWVIECVERLATLDGPIRLTSLPLESVGALSRWKFGLLRRLLFPFHPLTKQVACDRMVEVEKSLGEIAERHDVEILPTRGEWYRADAIHIRRSHRAAVFGSWLDSLPGVVDTSATVQDSAQQDERPASMDISSPSPRLRWPSRRKLKRAGQPGQLERLGPFQVASNTTLHLY